MNNLNVKEVIEDDVHVWGTVEQVREQINGLLDAVESGQYISLTGDLIAHNFYNNEIDIINIQAKCPVPDIPDRSVYGLSRVMFYNQTETNIPNDTLCNTTGIGIMPVLDSDNQIANHLVVRGYENFAQEIINLVPDETEELADN